MEGQQMGCGLIRTSHTVQKCAVVTHVLSFHFADIIRATSVLSLIRRT